MSSDPNPGSGGAERMTHAEARKFARGLLGLPAPVAPAHGAMLLRYIDQQEAGDRAAEAYANEMGPLVDSLRSDLERERVSHGVTRAERDGLVARLTNLCDLWRDLPRDGERAHAFGEAAAAVRHVLITPELSAPQQFPSDSPAEGFPPFGCDPEDSAALEKLRMAIDDNLIWPSDAVREAGDYEAAVRHSGDLALRFVSLAGNPGPAKLGGAAASDLSRLIGSLLNDGLHARAIEVLTDAVVALRGGKVDV